ncbi:hypothetical protein HPP92_002173 [Vanilla planifolia]|uniref:RING-type domain-containing protein n=1 Tax=Vanilla planifolia TaxID=51239 RepID=A0A835VG17_VANPL|nr:hypothetical protein HPP92_002173 [Vanilla planifolia]
MSVPVLYAFIPGELLTAFVLLLFFLFLVVVFLYLRARRHRVPNSSLPSSPLPSFFIFSSSPTPATVPLDPAVLKSLPSTIFHWANSKNGCGPVCAICLSELADGDAGRLLPGCEHAFHLECIDTWFLCNSTCPICRSAVEPPARPATESGGSMPPGEEIKVPGLPRSRIREAWDVETVAASREVCERI